MVEKFEYNIHFVPKRSIKFRVEADFLAEFNSLMSNETPYILFVNGALNPKGSGAGIALDGLDDLFLGKYIIFKFKDNKNQVEHESIIAGMSLAIEMTLRVS